MKNSTSPYFIAVMKKNNGARGLKGFSRVPGSSHERVDTEKEK
jgi:hypothetical protein